MEETHFCEEDSFIDNTFRMQEREFLPSFYPHRLLQCDTKAVNTNIIDNIVAVLVEERLYIAQGLIRLLR